MRCNHFSGLFARMRRRRFLSMGTVVFCLGLFALVWYHTGPALSQARRRVNRIVGMQRMPAPAGAGAASLVAIEVQSTYPFPVVDARPVLHIGAQQFALSRYHAGGDTHSLIFFVPEAAFQKAANGDRIAVDYTGGAVDLWEFGALDKRRLKP